MKIKNILAVILILSLFNLFVTPLSAQAIISKKNKKQKNKVETKLDYINYNWWADYNDRYLEEYILKALDNNQDMKIATLRVEEAKQAVRLQLSQELPTVGVGAAPSLTKLPSSTSTIGTFAIPIYASYEIDIFLKNRDKTRSAKKLYEASQYKEKAVYISVVSAVGTAYYNIVCLDKLIALQNEIIKDRKRIYELMKLRNEAGITSTSDLVKADKAYVISTSDLIELLKAREVALNTLAVLTGENPNNKDYFKRISYDNLKKKKTIPESISTEIITNRPDYQVSEKMLEKAKIDVRVAKKEFLPQFNILGLFIPNMTSASSSINWANAIGTVGAGALLPLFTGGRRIANLKIQKTRYEQMLQDYQKTNIVAIKEVNDSLSNLKLDEQKYQKNLKALNMEKSDFKYTQAQYNQGVISYLDLLQRKETVLVVEKMVTHSKIEGYIDQISLYKATAAANL